MRVPARLAGWRLALRLAWRDVRRSRSRTALTLLMVALPVLAVTVADTVILTAQVSGAEGVDRRLGTAQALVQLGRSGRPAEQDVDPANGYATGGGSADAPSIGSVRTALGEPDAPAVQLVQGGQASYRTDAGIGRADVVATDFASELTHGLYDLESGRVPSAADEVMVSPALAARGPGLGHTIDLLGHGTATVVGVADSTARRGGPIVFAPLGVFGVPSFDGSTASWLVGGAPVTWAQVRALNRIGVVVTSRSVLVDPPPASAVPADFRTSSGPSSDDVAVLALIVAMVLLEVVLLAGPAFAVGARRQARALALVAASGGTPQQARRVVLASGVVLGGLAGVGGVVLGVGAAAALLPVFQSFDHQVFGPFQVDALHLAGVAGFGVLSAVLASAVPAIVASRQDVVAVLAGRRSDAPPSVRSPVLGVALIALAVLGAAAGSRTGGGAFLIAVSAVVAVIGMVLVVPVVVVAVGAGSRRLPLPLRFAARDAARHRTRTVPAVAAVAATVSGVVALGIGLASSDAADAASYQPSLTSGAGVVTGVGRSPDWSAYAAVVRTYAPDATLTPVVGLDRQLAHGISRRAALRPRLTDTIAGPFSSQVLVSDGPLPPGLVGLDAAEVPGARATLARGGIVAFTDGRAPASTRTATVVVTDAGHGRRLARHVATAPVFLFHVAPGARVPEAVVSTAVVRVLGVAPATTGLVTSRVSPAQEQDITEGLAAVSRGAGYYVERGPTSDSAAGVVKLVLVLLGGVLMLGGTLTATFLSLSDARPDLATLSAVGASPRLRRLIAASYALVVALVGAVLGALVGLIPGIAVSYPLTSSTLADGTVEHHLAVPWSTVALVVIGLPLLSALLVGVLARSRLPLVSRLV